MRYDVSATSAARPERVFELLLDGSTWPAWSAIDEFTAERSADGTEEVRVFRTGSNVSRERVARIVPERRLDYEIVSGSRGLPPGYRGRIDLAPAAGGTRIRWRATWRSPFPGVGLLMQTYLSRFQQGMVDGLASFAVRQPEQ